MKSLFSQRVSAAAILKGIYSHLFSSGYRRFYLTPYVCKYVIMASKMRIKWTENAVIGFLTLFSSWFSPLGAIVSSLMIQKSSRSFSRSLRVSLLTFDISVNCPMRVNFACFMKLWPCILKWLHAEIAFGLLTSFLWLFSFKLKGISDYPTYWILHNMHSIKYMTYWLLRVSLWNILNVLFGFVYLLFVYSIVMVSSNYKAKTFRLVWADFS